jgi:beta-phosphoglucomutase-like phosphatase (HAD superfamily)
VIVSAQETGKSKPEPDIFLLTAEKLGINPANCLVVEDSPNGIKAAIAAGMTCVAYQGSGADPQKQKEADAVIQNFSQLEMMLL